MNLLRLAAVAGTVGASAAFGFTGTAAHAQDKTVDGPSVHWKYSMWGKKRAFSAGIEHVADELKKRTNGKFIIKIYYGEQLSKSKENLDGISLGAFEAAGFCGSYHPGKNAPITVLDLPFLPVKDFEAQVKMQEAVYNHPAAKKALDKWHARLYMANVLPPYEYMGTGEAPSKVSDFKGKRLRALGGMGEAARLIGATTVTMPSSETYTALQRGTVDGIGLPYTYAFAAFKLDEVATWVTTNMKLGSVTCPSVFNTKAYDKLPDQYKKLLDDLKPGGYDALKAAYAASDKKNLDKWRADKKPQLVEIPADQMADFRKIGGKPVWDAWVAKYKGEFAAQELLDIVLKSGEGN